MISKKKALIITDDSETTANLAEIITRIINKNKINGYSASIIKTEEFKGNDILPVQAFFLGCGEPQPYSFTYIEDLLAHINLSGRRCGVFSANSKAVKYLSGIIGTCEAVSGEPFWAKDGKTDLEELEKWINGILI